MSDYPFFTNFKHSRVTVKRKMFVFLLHLENIGAHKGLNSTKDTPQKGDFLNEVNFISLRS